MSSAAESDDASTMYRRTAPLTTEQARGVQEYDPVRVTFSVMQGFRRSAVPTIPNQSILSRRRGRGALPPR